MKLLEIVLTYGKTYFNNIDFKNENILEMFLHEIHPKQIILRLDDKLFSFYEVKYKYSTPRGNKKNEIKYFVFNTYSPEVDMKAELNKWIEEFNKENPSRKLLNVKFLKSRCLGCCKTTWPKP